jgi:hypothetical protein
MDASDKRILAKMAIIIGGAFTLVLTSAVVLGATARLFMVAAGI